MSRFCGGLPRLLAVFWVVSTLLSGCRTTPAPASGGGELVATVRSEPRTFGRLFATDRTSLLVSLLTHGKLVRINLSSQELEPWLAEGWTVNADGTTYTLTLRSDVRFSDGQRFSAADVIFSARAVYDERAGSPLGQALRVNGKPLAFSAQDESTVVVTFPAPYGPGLRMLDSFPIVPKHRLEGALEAGTLREAYGLRAAPSDIVGLGPFAIAEYVQGQRLTFIRNPHYWRTGSDGKQLPYLDRLRLDIVPDQNTELLKLEAGETDLVSGELRPEDLPATRSLSQEGKLQLVDLGVSLDPDFLWFNLTPGFAATQPDRRWLQREELRQAISYGVDRQSFVNAVLLGAGVPLYGPVTPGNRQWFDGNLERPEHDVAKARTKLSGLGFADRNGDGILDASNGRPVRFSLLTQRNHSARERGAAVLQQDLRALGIEVDVVALDQAALIARLMKGDYDAVYFVIQASDTDPATNLDFWLSSGIHPWNPGQAKPATDWEAKIDALMQQQMTTLDPAERKRLFDEVQRVFAEHEPAIYFAASRIQVAMSARVDNATPALLQPFVLWSADTLKVKQ